VFKSGLKPTPASFDRDRDCLVKIQRVANKLPIPKESNVPSCLWLRKAGQQIVQRWIVPTPPVVLPEIDSRAVATLVIRGQHPTDPDA
jgi:hypothetical protein